MSGLNPNPALSSHSSSSSPSRPVHSSGGDPTLASPSHDSSQGYDGSTLSPSDTRMSTAPEANQKQGGGCVEDEQSDVAGEGGDIHEGEDEQLRVPKVVERPGLSPRTSSARLRDITHALQAANILQLSPDQDWDTRPPGIDPRRVDVPDLKCRCVVQVAEWSAERVDFTVLSNKDGNGEIVDWLDKGRPEWAKVRWIHINGLSWDVLKPLALHFDLHPLSLEDMLHHGSSSSTRSKVDYFRQHLFVSLIVHRTLDGGDADRLDGYEGAEAALGVGMARSTTKGLKKGAGGKDRGGHLREQFGFHHHRRDEEAIIASTTSLPLPSNFPSTVPSASASASGSTTAGAGSYLATPIPTRGGSPLPGSSSSAAGHGLGPGSAVNPKSYAQYWRNLREAFKGVKRPREETIRTLSHNRSGLSTRFRYAARAGAHRTKEGREREKRARRDEDERAAARWTVAQLTKDVKVHIHVEQLGIFLFRDGTVLSFTQDAGYHPQISNLFERLQARDDLLRDSEDASFVLQALLDVTADDALEIVDECREQLTGLESKVLSRADMNDVRHLHILSSQLLLLKSTLTPLQQLLQSLRAQDDAKAAAAFRLDPATRPNSPHVGVGGAGGGGATPPVGHERSRPPRGFVSHEAKIYLGDVMDHVDSVLSSLDLFGDLSENLIAFAFNQWSYSSNAYMQALSVVSVIVMPATFLSSYFGMNFTTGDFVDELDKGVSLFWSVAIPVSLITLLASSYPYLSLLVQGLWRTLLRFSHKMRISRARKDA
ncbi:hypothetical protein JCM10207_002871 [Rhodosporidiobolus poonsookiae]